MADDRFDILLLEDDPFDADLLKRAIAEIDILASINWATNTTEAVQALQRGKYDVILSDLTLPDSFGVDTVAQLHAAAPEVPIVVLTSIDDRELAVRLLETGAQDYIPKACLTSLVLDRAMRHAIQRKEQIVESQRLMREINTTRDLLESKNSKLEKLFKQAHDFVDNVSHEFRTPLTVIKEYSSLLSEGFVGGVSEKQIQMLRIIENRADDLNTMVDDMLDSSKLEAGLIGAWRKPCTVSEILGHVTAALDRKAAVKGVKLEYHLDNDLPQLYCDAEKIGRVITNLGVNAIKFCGEPGVVRITVGAAADDRDVMFSVKDDGLGIHPDRLKQIFERFRQLGTTSRGSCKGFGLGLAIAKELVDLNFGQLHVESELDAGSTFSFCVPKNDPPYLIVRFLRYLQHVASSPPMVTVVQAKTLSNLEGLESDSVEGFLNHLLRRTDLLLRGIAGEWLIILPVGEPEVNNFIERYQQAWDAANRNRPQGPLPQLDLNSLGTWRNPDESQSIIDLVNVHSECQEIVSV